MEKTEEPPSLNTEEEGSEKDKIWCLQRVGKDRDWLHLFEGSEVHVCWINLIYLYMFIIFRVWIWHAAFWGKIKRYVGLFNCKLRQIYSKSKQHWPALMLESKQHFILLFSLLFWIIFLLFILFLF